MAILLSDAQIDMKAYCYSYHMNGVYNKIDNDFWVDENIHQTSLCYKFDYHKCKHRHYYFKKHYVCCFMLPFTKCSETYNHKDKDAKMRMKSYSTI